MPIKLTRLVAAAAKLTRQGHLLDATAALTSGLQRAIERAAEDVVPKARRATGTVKQAKGPGFPFAAPAFDRPSRTGWMPPTDPAVARTPGKSFVVGTHAFDGMTRGYKLFTPSQRAESPSLMVMLHGCTQDPDDFAAGTRMNAEAEAAGFLVLYPRQSRDANASACWNWFGAKEQRGEGETALLADLVRRIVAEEGVDPRRVFVAGLSAGGAMAAILAATHPTLFSGVAVHSGLPAGAASNLPDALLAMRNGARRGKAGERPVPTIVFHGDADRTVHPANGDRVIAAVLGDRPHAAHTATQGSGGGPAFTSTRHVDAKGRAVAEQWALHGAGHAWAGGANSGTYTDPKGVDATREMLRFFAEQRD